MKCAKVTERRLSEIRSYFAHYNLTLSESVCLTDYEMIKYPKVFGALKKLPKTVQREIISKNACKAPKPQCVYLPALRLKFSMPNTTSKLPQQDRALSSRKTDFQTSLSSRQELEFCARWKTLHFQLTKADTKARSAHNSTAGREEKRREAQLQRAKTTTFSVEQRPFQSINRIPCLSAA